MGGALDGKGGSELRWLCEFLSEIYPSIFKNRQTVSRPNEKKRFVAMGYRKNGGLSPF